MDYTEAFIFARSWGLFYLFLMFAGVLAYALWPRNKAKFDHAARIPLEED
jgi:cytochrome c oxidase cbb3-type subunit IV